MPTYDYRCKGCGHEFEEFQSMTAPVLKKCPSCGKLKLERLIGTGAALLFKGSGFYQTDYRTESYKKAADADKPSAGSDSKADAKPEAKPGGTPETKSESKSAAKSEPKSESRPASKGESKPSPGKPSQSRTAAKGPGGRTGGKK